MALRLSVSRRVAQQPRQWTVLDGHDRIWSRGWATRTAAARCRRVSTEAMAVADDTPRARIVKVYPRAQMRPPRPSASTSVSTRRPRRGPTKYMADSPNETLALWLRSRTIPGSPSPVVWQRFVAVARSRSLRLPVVTLQQLQRKAEAQQPSALSAYLCDEATWQQRLKELKQHKHVDSCELKSWAWILTATDADERIARFVGEECPAKPLFLLFQLLRRDATFHRGASLASLCRYIDQGYVQPYMPGVPPPPSTSTMRMPPSTFLYTLDLLVHHHLRMWPSALPAVAQLACAYLETLRSAGKDTRQTFATANHIFNRALELFQKKALQRPVYSMRYNWRAQKELLALSARWGSGAVEPDTPRTLLINRRGFEAIRSVLVAQRKSPAERRVAQRMTRTWPPYRRAWDGLDEQRQPEDDYSRSVRAGVLMQEAGYAETELGRALSVLGGVQSPGGVPTVQTRSLRPRQWRDREASHNVLATWAARVRATRDVNEAWHEFQTAPMPGLQPSSQVYAELFKKLVARTVDEDEQTLLLPGDAPTVLPVHDATLTTLEKQRRRPPSVEALYAQMRQAGCHAVGGCLVVLVQHAPSVEAGLQYLRASPTVRSADVAILAPSYLRKETTPKPQGRLRIPYALFTAYVRLLCRFQPHRTPEPARDGKRRRIGLLHHALRLCAQQLPATTHAGRTNKAPWHVIVRTLARPRVLVDPRHTENARFQDTAALALMLQVVARVRAAAGMDVVLFDSLNRAIHKCQRWVDAIAEEEAAEKANAHANADADADTDTNIAGRAPLPTPRTHTPHTGAVLNEALDVVVNAFTEMSADGSLAHFDEDDEDHDSTANLHHPVTAHDLNPGILRGYIQALGYMGYVGEMSRALNWVLETWNDATVFEDAKDPAHGLHLSLERAFVQFRAFAEAEALTNNDGGCYNLVRDTLRTQQICGCTWRWPTRAEADEYVRCQRHAGNAAFWAQKRPWLEAK